MNPNQLPVPRGNDHFAHPNPNLPPPQRFQQVPGQPYAVPFEQTPTVPYHQYSGPTAYHDRPPVPTTNFQLPPTQQHGASYGRYNPYQRPSVPQPSMTDYSRDQYVAQMIKAHNAEVWNLKEEIAALKEKSIADLKEKRKLDRKVDILSAKLDMIQDFLNGPNGDDNEE